MINLSFSTKVSLIVSFVCTLILSAYFLFTAGELYEHAEADLIHEGELSATILAEALSSSIWNFDKAQIEKIITSAKRVEDFSGVLVLDENNETAIAKIGNTSGNKDQIITARNVFYKLGDENKNIGIVKVFVDKSAMLQYYKHELTLNLISGLILIFSVAFSISIAIRQAAKPLRKISDSMLKYAKGDKEVSVPLTGRNDEIGALSSAFLQMKSELNQLYYGLEQQVKERTAELEIARKKAEDASREKSDFLANMSHEIRTPMNGVLGMANMLTKTNLDTQQKKYLTTIISSGKSLLLIINDILDFSKIGAGKMRLENILFSPQQIFGEMQDMFGPEIAEKKLAYNFELDESVKDFGTGDPTRLKQILINLISNAIKFTENGGVTISAKFLDKKLEVVVADTGIGIHQDKLKMIFEKFTQEDSSTTRKFGGTGLGLAITSKLVKMMNGEISVSSEPGKGAEFSFFVMLG